MSARIMLIEDEDDIRGLLRDILEGEGFSVFGANRPELALDTAEQLKPDLFIIDLMLHDMDGIELALRLRTIGFEATPMIGISASNLMVDLGRDSHLFRAVLSKPFDLEILRETIESCLS